MWVGASPVGDGRLATEAFCAEVFRGAIVRPAGYTEVSRVIHLSLELPPTRWAAPTQVLTSKLMQSIAAEARIMSGVHDLDGQRQKAVHRVAVVIDRRVGKVVEQRAVVDRIAAEQGAGRMLPERNRAGRVTRKVQHLEVAIARVERVTLADVTQRRYGQRE